jgi:hypothetical protein
MAPLMNLETVLKLKETFDANYSSWGLDGIWPHMLDHPKNKIAIIDTIRMTHTKPPGSPELYSQFPHSLKLDEEIAYNKFTNGLRYPQKVYTQIPL